MSDRIGGAAAAPRWVTCWGPIATFLLAAGVPMGPNALITIRGRMSLFALYWLIVSFDEASRQLAYGL